MCYVSVVLFCGVVSGIVLWYVCYVSGIVGKNILKIDLLVKGLTQEISGDRGS